MAKFINSLTAGYNMGNNMQDRRRAVEIDERDYADQRSDRQFRNNLLQREFDERKLAKETKATDEEKQWLSNGARTLSGLTKNPAMFQQAANFYARHPIAQKYGITAESITPESVLGLVAQMDMQAGAAPQAAQKSDIRAMGDSFVDLTNPNQPRTVYTKPVDKNTGPQFTALMPAEIASAGLPPGTSAQRDMQTGKIDVLSKRDNTGSLSQKDATTARLKLNTVALARKQLENIRIAFLGAKDAEGERKGGIKGTFSAGYAGQGYLPSEGGNLFDKSVDQMRSTLTALTRVPGVGAMSDYETKLDQAKFPSRKNYESVTEAQINALEDQLALIENGYRGLLEGQVANQPSNQGQQGPVRVNSPQEAMSLPPGTQFQTPDGRIKVRP